MTSFTYLLNGEKVKIYRKQVSLELEVDPLLWLKKKKLYPKVFWKDKTTSTLQLALGSLIFVEKIPEISIYNNNCVDKDLPKFFGTTEFQTPSLLKKKTWELFTPIGFFLPRIHLSLEHSKALISVYSLKEEDLTLETYLSDEEEHLQTLPPLCIDRTDLPNFEEWHSLLKEALHYFRATPLQKVVLARASQLTFKEDLCPLSLLAQVSKQAKNSTLFAYLPSKEQGFIGASPEHLYKREGKNLFTEAIAGTRALGKTEKENKALLQELRENLKEQKEFEYVRTFLEKTFSSLCLATEETKVTVIQTGSAQHLYQAFYGILKEKISDKDLAHTLHPTPAIGGFPKALSLQFIDRLEPFARGLYAAPLGWISPASAEFIVGIRSALVQKNTLTLFAGAGIVEGSDPTKEWNELELKISQFVAAYAQYC